MNNALWLVLGLFFGAVLIMYARKYRAKGEKIILAKALIVAAIIYVLFAIIWGNTTWIGNRNYWCSHIWFICMGSYALLILLVGYRLVAPPIMGCLASSSRPR